jgi:hypothetical protein
VRVFGPGWRLRDGDLHHRTCDLLPLCREHHRAPHELWEARPAWRRLGREIATVGTIAALRRNLIAAP